MSANYAWIIDFEWVPDEGYGEARSITGPQRAHSLFVNKLIEDVSAGRKFRMRDDDGNLIYEGRILTRDDDGTEKDFAPLDQYGAPNAGCTVIEYLENGEWKVL